MILAGWKQISTHLRYGVRTVQRWERYGLPVKRVTTSPRGPVVADSEELDSWILHRLKLPPGAPRKTSANLQRARQLRRKAQQIGEELQETLEALKKTVAVSCTKLRR